jgi:hypothetical protein
MSNFWRVCAVGVGLLLLACEAGAGSLDAVVERNLAVEDLASVATLDSMLADEQAQPTAVRVGAWARRYLAWGKTEYRFGLAEDGYVGQGLLVPGRRQDCVSLVYRTTELARAADARAAVELALDLRFAGADRDRVILADGRVDYDRPEHLDYSLDMIRSGHWGRDVTATLAGAAPDPVGSSRYPAGSFVRVVAGDLQPAELREGDVAWLVFDPGDPDARRLRDEHGLVIGHLGIVILEDGEPWLVHAASKPLPGWYDRPGVVSVPLTVYLARVERYGGVMITRFDALTDLPAPGPPGSAR